MCLRPESLTLAMPLHGLYIIFHHIHWHLGSWTCGQIRAIVAVKWSTREMRHSQVDLCVFTSDCLIIVQDAGSGGDWVWLETVFWLELDNAWSSPPSSGAVMFCMADITPPVGILSTIFLLLSSVLFATAKYLSSIHYFSEIQKKIP